MSRRFLLYDNGRFSQTYHRYNYVVSTIVLAVIFIENALHVTFYAKLTQVPNR